jgi:ABC-2 type transport system permease protein
MVARFADEPDLSVATVFGFSAVFTAVFAAVSGILAYTTEAEHHTAHQTFAAEPRRGIVIAAKAITTAGYTALLSLAGLAAGAFGAALGGVEAGDTSTIPAMMSWATGFAVLAGILGLGVGLIARQSAAAISGVLVWWLVVENLVSAFAPERVVRLMPFFAGNGMLDMVNEGERIAFDRPATTLIFAAYAIAALSIGALATARTDP